MIRTKKNYIYIKKKKEAVRRTVFIIKMEEERSIRRGGVGGKEIIARLTNQSAIHSLFMLFIFNELWNGKPAFS